MGASLWRLATESQRASAGARGPVVALAIGTLPVLLSGWLGPAHQVLAAALLFPLFLGTVAADRPARGLLLVGICFFAHNALTITLAARDPTLAAALPDAADYWARQRLWITTGRDPEYELINWLPAHIHLFAGVGFFSYVSMGFVTFVQGFYEVDLMNFYVGRLIASSDSMVPALLLGWHPWSALRGLCYLVITWEIASWSLARMTGRALSTPEHRLGRWLAAAGLFCADCLTKAAMLDIVRLTLLENLAVGG